jgi:protein XagA
LSSGDFNQSINVQAGHSFYPLPAYFNVFLLFNNRTEGYSDELNYGIEAGYTFYTDLSVIAKAKGQQPMYNGRDDKIGGAGVLLNDQRYIAYGVELVYKLTNNFGLIVFFESGTAGKNIVSAPVYTVGIYYAN